ncbi:hypothetical protein Lbys_0033 [Leadbetterella byssophila DSM 17132]|uniref:Uncharacterized protein n=2 Tax=Leadbetterella TaxID=319458 RepID=E4RS13_LEAB4|nr:hypothetical protein Lbys_0033 [Leadbetterella byssophila DSM 17132]
MLFTPYLTYKMKILLGLLFLSLGLQAQTLNISGNWNITIAKPTVPGSNYLNSYESSTNAVILSGSDNSILTIGAKYTFSVSMTGALPSGVKLYARRTADGTIISSFLGLNVGNYSDGLSYLELTNFVQALFYINITLAVSVGTTLFQNIPIQYKLEGLSVTQPTGTYTVTVTYTVSK